MSVERIIGIDLGTSTSVIRVKRYKDGKPLGDRLTMLPVTFNMGSTIVPTLIQKVESSVHYGFDAQVPRRRSTLFQNFKVNLESANPAEQEQQARSLISEYLSFLGKEYRAQSDGGHLGEADDMERTIVSYPVKWGEQSRAFIINAAKEAGFPNVEGMDEAQAAIQAVTVQNAHSLTERGYFLAGIPVHVLLIDMGAGTTDLVLCCYTPGSGEIEIKSTWPKSGEALFGGREVDERLMEYIRSKIPADEAGVVFKRCGLEQFKTWKETILSPALKRDDSADEFSALDTILDLLEIDAEDYSMNRSVFEDIMEEYLRGFPQLINGCLADAGMDGDDVDLVILTGGHSQWYFVREMLAGIMLRFGEINLGKIRRDAGRIVPIPLPQETVALGLAYSRMSDDVLNSADGHSAPERLSETLTHVSALDPTCTERGNLEYWVRNSDKQCFFDAEGRFKADWRSIQRSALGHEFVEGRCVRCGFVQENNPPHVSVNPMATQLDDNLDDAPTPEEEFLLGNDGQDYEIVKYLGKREHVVIPETIRGRKVSSIGANAFDIRPTLRSITIPKTVKKIGQNAFFRCKHLTSVKLHDEIEEIDNGAFNVTAVTIFDFGQGLPEPNVVKLPRSLKRIGKGALGGQWRDYTLSKKTEVQNPWLAKTLNGAVFYYEDMPDGE